MDEKFIELAAKIKSGDYAAFSDLYRQYYKKLSGFAFSYLHDEFVATSIVQDSFTTLWEQRDKIEIETNLPAYLLTIVKNKTLNHLHRQQIKERVEENVQSHVLRELELRASSLNACDPEQLFQSDIEQIVRKTLDALPDQCRRVMMMSRFGGMSNKDIATKLGISVKAVEFHITKALKFLRHNLKDYLITLLLLLKLF